MMLQLSPLALVAFAALTSCAHADITQGHLRSLNEFRRLNTTSPYGRPVEKVNMEDVHEGNGYSEKLRRTAKASKGTKKSKTGKSTKGKTEDEELPRAPQREEPPRPLPPSRPLTSISLGNVRPEGILAVFDDFMLTSEFGYGGIKKVNILTGKISQVVPSYAFMERGALGLEYFEGHVFVAGGGFDSKLFVYDVETGTQVAACAAGTETSFLNDVAIVGNYAYVADSFNNAIMVVDVAKALLGVCTVLSIETPAELFQSQDGEFLADGIIGYGSGLIISRNAGGGLFFLNLYNQTHDVLEIASPEDSPVNDGLSLAGDLLYSCENQEDRISVWKLKGKEVPSLTLLGHITNENFDFPSSGAIYGDLLYTVSMRLAKLPFPADDEELPDIFDVDFYMTGVDRFDYE